MRPIRRLSFLALLLAGSAASADVVERSFDAAPGGVLTLETDRGSIDVRTAPGSEVRVTVRRSAGLGADDGDHRVSFDASGADVTIRGETERRGLWNRSRMRVEYEIVVPERYDLRLRTAGGDVQVAGIDGEVTVSTSGGDVDLGSIAGRVEAYTSGGNVRLEGSSADATLKTSGGDVKVGRVGGSIEARTSGGDVTIERADGDVIASSSGGDIDVSEVTGSIDARTSGGDVSARISGHPTADCRLTTSGGRIRVAVREDVALDLDASTSGGGIRLDLPVTVEGTLSRSSVRGAVNGGGPQLYLRSSGGSITIEKL